MNLAKLNIQKLSAYKPPLGGRSHEGLLRLDFNERTLSPPQFIRDALKDINLNLYPEYRDLDALIADYAGVREGQILSCNGSDQAIDVIFRTFLSPAKKVIIPEPTFNIYSLIAGVVGAEVVSPEYAENGDFPLDELLSEIDESVAVIVLCNPNNPTGGLISIEQIEQVLQAAPNAIVYVDEAYYEFSGVTAVSLMERYENLVVTRTFSKAFGLSALRVGYAIAHEAIVEEMLKVRGPYDVNMAGTLAARAALKQPAYVQDYVDMVMNESKPMLEAFLDDCGVRYLPSSSNFIMLLLENAVDVCSALRDGGILTRPKLAPSGQDALRVSIGTPGQTQKFIDTLKPLLK